MKALNRLEIRDVDIWKDIGFNIDRLLHQLDHSKISTVVDLFTSNYNNSKDLVAKVVTFLPLHVNKLGDFELIRIMKITLNKGLCSERLFRSFFCKRLEQRAGNMKFELYFKALKMLAKQRYQV